MLIIRPEQMQLLAAAYREGFLDRLAGHLAAVAAILEPDRPHDFQGLPARQRLRQRLDYLLGNGFEREPEAAAAMEQWEVFGIDLGSGEAAAIIAAADLWPDEKLDQILTRRGGGDVHE